MFKKIPFLKILFFIIGIMGAYYIALIQTEKHMSQSVVAVKDLAGKQSISSVGSLILGQGDINARQNLELINVYIRSREVFEALDREYRLRDYYTSETMDPLQRLRPSSPLIYNNLDIENLIKAYNNDLETVYDDLSATLMISFYHADPKIAKKIITSIIGYAEDAINKFESESAKILVKFLEGQEKHYKQKHIESVKKMIEFQNREGLIDPTIDIKATSELLASLESELIKLKVEYQAKRVIYAANTAKAKTIKKQIDAISAKIKELRKKLAGKGSKKLNKDQFAFEVLKSELKFNQELYYQTLLKLEDARISASQNAKKLIVVVEPTTPEQYARPNKLRDILTLFIVLIFLFGVIRISSALLREHKD